MITFSPSFFLYFRSCVHFFFKSPFYIDCSNNTRRNTRGWGVKKINKYKTFLTASVPTSSTNSETHNTHTPHTIPQPCILHPRRPAAHEFNEDGLLFISVKIQGMTTEAIQEQTVKGRNERAMRAVMDQRLVVSARRGPQRSFSERSSRRE